MKNVNTIIFEFDPAAPPDLTAEEKQELEKLARLPDSEIDYTDIPCQNKLAGFQRVNSVSELVRVDRDILEWIKTLGNDREALINGLLRQQMKAALGG